MIPRLVIALSLLCLNCATQAQERDPTAAPAEVGVLSTMSGSADPATVSQGSSVVVRNGRPHLVAGTRLVAVGQKVGNARLERITETEIWLREGKQLTKVPRYAGIQRSVARTSVECKPALAKRNPRSQQPVPVSSTQAVTPAAPCDGAQP